MKICRTCGKNPVKQDEFRGWAYKDCSECISKRNKHNMRKKEDLDVKQSAD